MNHRVNQFTLLTFRLGLLWGLVKCGVVWPKEIRQEEGAVVLALESLVRGLRSRIHAAAVGAHALEATAREEEQGGCSGWKGSRG